MSKHNFAKMNISAYILHTYMYNTHYIPIVVGCCTVCKECNYLVPVYLMKQKQ